MKVLVLTSNYPRKNELNNGIFIHQQVKALQELGAECHVLLLHNWYPPFGLHKYHGYWREGHSAHTSFHKEYEGVPIYSVPMFIKMPSRFFPESLYDRADHAIRKQVKKHKALQGADWLYAHFLTDNGYIGARIKDALGVKLAAIARGDDVHAWPEYIPALQQHFPLVFEKTDLLLANSSNLGRDAQKWMQPGKVRAVETVYNGIDYEKYRPAADDAERAALRKKFDLADGVRYLVCAAAPVALKGWNELLQAVKAAGTALDGWQLLMVAPPRHHPDAIDLVQKAQELGITNRVRHINGLSPADLSLLYRAADAFVLPSYNEGMANALLEAMASGLPCIATEVGGHNEVMANGVDGFLVPPRSVQPLAAALSQLATQEQQRLQMGLNARKRMLALGNYKHNAAKLLRLMEGFSKANK